MQQYTYEKLVNSGKLHSELVLAGYEVSGVTWYGNGNVTKIELPDDETKNPDVIVEAHVYSEPSIHDDLPRFTKEDKLNYINAQLQTYIYSKYDQGTQISFNAIFADPDTPEVAKTTIKTLKAWIMSILSYYYQAKQAITNNTPWNEVSWNLSQFDATDPGLHLSDFIGG